MANRVMICAKSFCMAEEAFALSPISARAALPSEEDYAAISEAFMETSRGRWFLGEYAKRNRNADTRMVLDAVARIEESIASQKQAASDTQLTEALAAIRQAVGKTQTATGAALDAMALDQHLAPIRKGVRVIREISWRLREIGADGRICDIIDSQVTAIETGAEQISAAKPQLAVNAAFAELLGELAEYEARGDVIQASAPEEEARVVPFPTPADAAAVTEVAAADPEPPPQTMEAPPAAMETPTAAMEALAETMQAPAEAMALPESAEPVAQAADFIDEAAAEAQDEAVLDLIAAEMSAPEPMGMDEIFEIGVETASAAEPASVASAPDIVAESSLIIEAPPVQETAAIKPEIQVAPQPVVEPAPKPPVPEPAHEGSLGSSIIASGMLRKPSIPNNDPLAPIRRMSQAERIAFFS
jgi:hypothetical protein